MIDFLAGGLAVTALMLAAWLVKRIVEFLRGV
jgi:hypothetical protein